MRLLIKLFTKLANWGFVGIIVLLFNVFLLDLYAIYPCDWPCPDCPTAKYTKVMILTDPHLLGKSKGHPVDKFVREWEMGMAFQLAKSIRRPDVIIFLGDLLDEGLSADEEDFTRYVSRFKAIFPIESRTEKIYVVGDHDIGFHDRIASMPNLRRRWSKAFNSSLAKYISIKGIKFISINSMAFEGDDFALTEETENYLSVVDAELANSSYPGRPILLLHFPFYRPNDDICQEVDSQKGGDRLRTFTPGVDCLSKNNSLKLLERFRPRLIFNGHIHSGCFVNHSEHDAQEWTVASFNWRFRYDPNYLLLKISREDHYIVKCFLPSEISVLTAAFLCLFTLSMSSRVLANMISGESSPKSGKSKKKEKIKPPSKGITKRRRISRDKY